MSSGGSDSGNSPFAWLGLLKWSLAYTDGTSSDQSNALPMSEEDRTFLEKVMAEGIVDEGERMKTILKDLTDGLEVMMMVGTGSSIDDADSNEEKVKELDEDDMVELLEELRDIVEQIDYARAFMALGGIPFLLGLATHINDGVAGTNCLPKLIRRGALKTMSTMCQNNPPVQLCLLENGHIPQLIELFIKYTPGGGRDGDDDIRADVIQALSASVREHSMAEQIFCMNKEAKVMLELGLGMKQIIAGVNNKKFPKPSVQLRKRSSFFLRALLTSDDATNKRHIVFEDIIVYVCTREIDDEWEDDAEIREISLAMISRLLSMRLNGKQSGGEGWTSALTIILRHKNNITSIVARRIQHINALEEGSEEKANATIELDELETLMVALDDAGRNFDENDVTSSPAPTLALCNS
jgi:hsp70-interacting protein